MNDQELSESLAPLRECEPDDAVRAKNRRVALNAAPEQTLPWWRRSVAVPVPVALTTAAAAAVCVGWGLYQTASGGGEATEPRPSAATPMPPGGPASQVVSLDQLPRYVAYESASYVSGVGFVNRVTHLPAPE